MIQIELNGKPHQLTADASISELLEQLGHAGRRVAVEVNRSIVPRSKHAEYRLASGDVVELVHALGGG
jgi:sulfur carrier protein